jgi:hypothetical protein
MKPYWNAINDDEGKEITSVALHPEFWWLGASRPIPVVLHAAATFPAYLGFLGILVKN